MSIQQVFMSGRAIGKAEAKADQMVQNAMTVASDAAEAGQQKREQAVSMACGAMDMVKSTTSDAFGAVYNSSAGTEETEKKKSSGGAMETVKSTTSGAVGAVKNSAVGAGEAVKNTIGMGN